MWDLLESHPVFYLFPFHSLPKSLLVLSRMLCAAFLDRGRLPSSLPLDLLADSTADAACVLGDMTLSPPLLHLPLPSSCQNLQPACPPVFLSTLSLSCENINAVMIPFRSLQVPDSLLAVGSFPRRAFLSVMKVFHTQHHQRPFFLTLQEGFVGKRNILKHLTSSNLW